MEIFQDGIFPNLEYHFFQVTWCVSAYLMLSDLVCYSINYVNLL